MEDVFKLLVVVAVAIYHLYSGWKKHVRERQLEAPPTPPPPPKLPKLPTRRVPPAEPRGGMAPRPVAKSSTNHEVGRAIDRVRDSLEPTLLALEENRTTRRLAEPMRVWVDQRVGEARARNARGDFRREWVDVMHARLNQVLAVTEELASERRNPDLAPRLGDADALAVACYRPVIDWTRAEHIPLAASEPVTFWGDFDLAVWTGFQPTGIAPIFLPVDFFERAAWWPAIAHEIGHSFLASCHGLDAGLRTDLGLPDERTGRRGLRFHGDSLPGRELDRIFGGWFEELFCDVFATLMQGPAYVATMHRLFAADGDPRSVLAVHHDDGIYDEHPPWHLRLIAACRVLERRGLTAEAKTRRAAWDLAHSFEGNTPDRILFPMPDPHEGGWLALPLAPLEQRVVALVDRLIDGPLPALSGMSLSDVGGLSYGPHAHMEGERAKAALLAGRVPKVRDARDVVTGLVLALEARPAEEERLLVLARRAIPALGTGEQRVDAYSPAEKVVALRSGQLSPALIREAMIVSALFDRPARRP